MVARPQTSDRLRHDIDRGRAGDKVDFFDPAAAPLGTDDEAAGTPLLPESIQLAHSLEIGRPATSSRDEGGDSGVLIYFVVILGLVVGFAVVFWLV